MTDAARDTQIEAPTMDATRLHGWQWMPGMQLLGGSRVHSAQQAHGVWILTFAGMGLVSRPATASDHPDPTDPATAGCLLALLGRHVEVIEIHDGWSVRLIGAPATFPHSTICEHLGAACIAVAESLGRWPGGAA